MRKILFSVIILANLISNQITAQVHPDIKFEKVIDEQGIIENSDVLCILQDHLGYIWFGTNTEYLIKYDGNTFKYYEFILNDTNSFKTGAEILFEDSENNLWIGGNGLSQYNRNADNFSIYYPEPDSINLPSNYYNLITSIKEDNNGNLWLSTYEGYLYRFSIKNRHFKLIDKETKDNKHIISMEWTYRKDFYFNQIYCASDNKIWLTPASGLWAYDQENDTFQSFYYSKQKDSTKYFSHIIEDEDSNIWASSFKSGMLKLNPNKNMVRFYKKSPGNPDSLQNDFYLSHKANNNAIWFSSFGHLSKYLPNKDGFETYKLDTALAPIIICEENNGDFWLNLGEDFDRNTSLGYFSQSRKEFQTFFHSKDNPNSYPATFLYDFVKDYSGCFWFATDDGLYTYNPIRNKFRPTLGPKHFKNQFNNVTCFQEYDANLLFGTDNGLFQYNFTNKQIKHWNTENGLKSNVINDIKRRENGEIWVATEKGLFVINKKGKVINPNFKGDTHNILNKNRIFNIFIKSDTVIWIGSAYQGHVKLTTSIYKPYEWNYQSYSEIGKAGTYMGGKIDKDEKNRIWAISPYGGLKLYNPSLNKFEIYADKNINFNGGKNFVVQDNKIWISNTHNGLSLFNIDSLKIIKVFKKSNGGLPNNKIYDIALDKNGDLWLNTTIGLCRFNTKNFTYRLFDENDGIDALSKGKLYINKNEKVYYGGGNCIYRFHPDSIVKDTIKPKLKFTKLTINGKTILPTQENSPLENIIEETDRITLQHNQNFIRLTYAALHYNNPNQINYSFKLVGIDDKYQEVGNQNYASYNGLPAGDYTFMLKAQNSDNVWSDEIKLAITILPPWWKSNIAYGAYALFMLILVFGYIKLRERALKKEKEVLERKVDERTNEITEKNEELRQQNEEITSQRDEIEAQRNLAIEQKQFIENQNTSIKASINYAQRIQTAMLPPEGHINELLNENFIFYKPKDIVSGDFYWVKQINHNIVIVAADCTGHGVPGAFMSMLGISFLNEIVQKREITQANQVLNELRKQIKHSLRQHGGKDTSMDGIDMAICVLDLKTNKMQYAGAYNPLILVKYKNDKPELIEIKADRRPVGFYQGRDKSFTNHVVDLEIGDTFYIFSDGYADQMGGQKGKKFMSANFKNLLLEIHEQPLYEQKEILDKTMQEWMKGEEQMDDMLVIGVRI